MPNGLWYARGPCGRTYSAVPASAFSKGDLLMLDSNSSLSRINVLMASGLDYVGVAMADSTQSINNKVTALVPDEDTEFWCSLSSAIGSHVTAGTEGELLFAVANNRTYLNTSSANSVIARVVVGTPDISQSVQSRVIVRLIRSGGEAEF